MNALAIRVCACCGDFDIVRDIASQPPQFLNSLDDGLKGVARL